MAQVNSLFLRGEKSEGMVNNAMNISSGYGPEIIAYNCHMLRMVNTYNRCLDCFYNANSKIIVIAIEFVELEMCAYLINYTGYLGWNNTFNVNFGDMLLEKM